MQNDEQQTYYDMASAKTLACFEVDADEGLSEDEVRRRQERFGTNRLSRHSRRSKLRLLVDQFKSIVILILLGAALFALATARLVEAVALFMVTIVNTGIGFFTELKATRSMEALRHLGRHSCRVIRQGEEKEVATEQLVPGDIIHIGEGELVPADIRLVVTEGLRVNEAALTGESAPVNKSDEPVASGSVLHERWSMLFKGTSVVEGQAKGVVVATAMDTELGRIARLTSEAKEKTTPLQRRLDQLGRRLAWITIGVAVLIAAAGLAVGRDTVLMIETAIALGIAAIPEGLPIVATIALARGMWLMAKRNALVNRLTAVETLGATTIIFSDKTGTLTRNNMRLVRAATAEGDFVLSESGKAAKVSGPGEEGDSLERLLTIGVLCSNAQADDETTNGFRGDPTEVALLQGAEENSITRKKVLEKLPEVREVPFDSKTMKMATVHRLSGEDEKGYYVAVKGAPQAILDSCTTQYRDGKKIALGDGERSRWARRVDELAARGLRLLALADGKIGSSDDEVYTDLRFIGLVALEDPPRDDVQAAIEECMNAGIRVAMVTGDRADTGQAIAERVGLDVDGEPLHGEEVGDLDTDSEELRERIRSTNVFARVTPEQKLKLVKLYQDQSQIVAMTGDGVNDTPALKQADIGIAMGKKGTDAAKQVADMVLRDDRFSTIVAAVKEGRIIYGNIRKSVIFMLCTNIAEVLSVAIASLLQLPIPLKPLQILYLNMLTDVFPALALGVGIGSGNVMRQRPKKSDEPVLTAHHWRHIGLWSVVMAGTVLCGLVIARYVYGVAEEQAVTVSFMTLALGKLWFVVNLRDRDASFFKNDVTANPWVWGAWGLCLLLLLLAVYWPPLAGVLGTAGPGIAGWATILCLSLLPVILGIRLAAIRFY